MRKCNSLISLDCPISHLGLGDVNQPDTDVHLYLETLGEASVSAFELGLSHFLRFCFPSLSGCLGSSQ